MTLTPGVGVKVRKEIGGELVVLEAVLVMVLVLEELGGMAKVLAGPDL